MNLEAFNNLAINEQVEHLIACCHCRRWAEEVATQSPFEALDVLLQAAQQSWKTASQQEILEAFAGHPQIGDMAALRNRFAKTASAEQGQVVEADEAVLVRLKKGNEAYLEKFGFIFIVFASGKTANEMLGLLEARLANSRAEELQNGAREQGQITRLRLSNLIEDES